MAVVTEICEKRSWQPDVLVSAGVYEYKKISTESSVQIFLLPKALLRFRRERHTKEYLL